jgi:hypothetical protein
MTSISERYSSSLMTAQDVEAGDLDLQISYVEWDVPIGKDTRDLVHFVGEDRCLALTPTNARALARLHGDDGDKWRGKWVTLYYDPKVEYQDRKVGGIRVRDRAPSPPAEGNGPLPEPPRAVNRRHATWKRKRLRFEER